MKEYTERIDGFQIRDLTYFPGYEPEVKPREFDIVKWQSHAPRKVRDLSSNKEIISTENCYSVAHLIWDNNEREFSLNSIGLRWLDAEPNDKVCKMIKNFAMFKTAEYNAIDCED